ncbi:RbcX protein [Synechococcus sp. PCC 6312]|nr:chaperonin family protein RbcX [Synechococcus sp. PCC 6312]AFY61140.1 RbcX protein [Synechococcus sp. PCC 6312]
MDVKHVAKETAKTLISYLTYQAVRTVIAQLDETDPPRSLWLQRFTTKERVQDGELYLQDLFQEKQDLAFRILTVREHLADQVADFLPEMLRTGIQKANLHQRCQQLERMTQVAPAPAPPEASSPTPADLTDSTHQPNS